MLHPVSQQSTPALPRPHDNPQRAWCPRRVVSSNGACNSQPLRVKTRKTPFQLRVGAEAHTIDQMPPSVQRGLTETEDSVSVQSAQPEQNVAAWWSSLQLQPAKTAKLRRQIGKPVVGHRGKRTPGPTTPEDAVPANAAARGLAYRVPPTLCPSSDAVFFHWRAGRLVLVALTLMLADWCLWNGERQVWPSHTGRVVCVVPGLQPKLGRQEPTIRSSFTARQAA